MEEHSSTNISAATPTTGNNSLTTLSSLQLQQHQQRYSAEESKIHALVLGLLYPEKRESSLLELSKKREVVPNLAPILWHSFGTVAVLLQEIISIYPLLSPPRLKAHASNRVCNALALLQCVASHKDTRTPFLNGIFLNLQF